jgi:hypothetical protein
MQVLFTLMSSVFTNLQKVRYFEDIGIDVFEQSASGLMCSSFIVLQMSGTLRRYLDDKRPAHPSWDKGVIEITDLGAKNGIHALQTPGCRNTAQSQK